MLADHAGRHAEAQRGTGEAAAFHHLGKDPHVVEAVHRTLPIMTTPANKWRPSNREAISKSPFGICPVIGTRAASHLVTQPRSVGPQRGSPRRRRHMPPRLPSHPDLQVELPMTNSRLDGDGDA